MVKVGSPIREMNVQELIPVLGSQPAGDRSHKPCHKPCGRLPLLSARPAVTFTAAEHHRLLVGTKLLEHSDSGKNNSIRFDSR